MYVDKDRGITDLDFFMEYLCAESAVVLCGSGRNGSEDRLLVNVEHLKILEYE